MRISRSILFGLALAGLPALGHAALDPGEPTDLFTMENWVTGVNNVTDIAFLSDGRAVITRKQGQVVVTSPTGDVVGTAMVMVDSGSEKGLLGVVRDDQDTLYFYASTGNDNGNKHKVYKGTVAEDGTVTIDLDNPIVSMGLEGPANHDGGGLVIHKNQLYISVGDTGENNTPPQNKYGACLNKPNGSILRVNLDGSVPTDNPLSNLDMVTGCAQAVAGNYQMMPPDKRIYMWGFRNPWRFWIDPETELFWIGDVGESYQEEISVGKKGDHFGWPFEEGDRKYNMNQGFSIGGLRTCMDITPAGPCVPPVDSYGRNLGQSVTGGLIPPKNCGWGAYEQKYFFGDYETAVLWTLDVTADRSGAMPMSRKSFGTLATGNNAGPVSFRTGPDGAMYIAAYNPGAIVRLAPKNIPDTCKAAAPVDAGSEPVDAGAGGSGGGGSAGASGGGGASGGSSGTAGSPGGAGSGSGGSSAAGSGGGTSSDGGGCSCDVGGRPGGGAWFASALLLGLMLQRRRRRRR